MNSTSTQPPAADSRAELLKKCQEAQKKARLRGLPPPRRVKKSNTEKKEDDAAAAAAPPPLTPPTEAAAAAAAAAVDDEMKNLTVDMLKDLRSGILPANKVKDLADLEKDLYEECGGDMEVFCKKHGVNDSAYSAIEGSIADMMAGSSLEDTLVSTMKHLGSAK